MSLLMLVAWLAMITHNLHPPYHCSEREETQHFRSDQPQSDYLLPIGVSDVAKYALGGVGVCGGAGA